MLKINQTLGVKGASMSKIDYQYNYGDDTIK
jgi:hypothetical protein